VLRSGYLVEVITTQSVDVQFRAFMTITYLFIFLLWVTIRHNRQILYVTILTFRALDGSTNSNCIQNRWEPASELYSFLLSKRSSF